MAYELRFASTAVKQLRKLETTTARRIVEYLEAVVALEDPAVRGKNLTGEYSGIWRYRVGDYRVLCDVDKTKLVVLALEISHRSKSYRRR